ncbi:hypothetical protein Q6240_32345, partial [Klebsiella pneumoniae]
VLPQAALHQFMKRPSALAQRHIGPVRNRLAGEPCGLLRLLEPGFIGSDTGFECLDQLWQIGPFEDAPRLWLAAKQGQHSLS